MERRIQKRRKLTIYRHCFYSEDLSQIEWSVTKKTKNGRIYETKVEDKEHLFDYCLEFDTNKKI